MDLDAIRTAIDRNPRKILHIGANRGGEAKLYEGAGITGYHVEAIPEMFALLKARCEKLPNQHPIEACLHEDRRRVRFNVSSNFASSSLLGLGRHAAAYPEVTYTHVLDLQTETVDGLILAGQVPGDVDFAVLDVQGAELNVLKGGPGFLASRALLGMMVEVSLDPLYDGGATFQELSRFVEGFGFFLRQITFNEDGWGDATYARRWWKLSEPDIPPLYTDFAMRTKGVNIAVTGDCTQSSEFTPQDPLRRNDAVRGPRGAGYAFHTAKEPRPWWLLDLKTVRRFDEVVIFNRIDACRDRAARIKVEVSEDQSVWQVIWTNEYSFGGVDGRPLRIECQGRTARYLRILGGPDDCLHLNHVEVYDWQAKGDPAGRPLVP